MNVDYNDGRREVLTGLTPDQLAEHVRRATEDPQFAKAEILHDLNGETNRHARRRAVVLSRKKGKGKK